MLVGGFSSAMERVTSRHVHTQVKKDCIHRCDEDSCLLHDLQLAAELGKTLLERNKELEAGLKQQQRLIDDQSREIQYLSRQTEGLREVNDSRLRLYEQLEVSIQELENNNQTIKQQLKQHKQRNATLTVDREECQCAELQSLVDQLRSEIAISSSQHPCPPVRQDIQPCPNCTAQQTMATEMSRQLTECRSSEREQRRLRREAEQEMSAYRQRCSELEDELEALRLRVIRFQHLTHNLQSLQERRFGPFAAVDQTIGSDGHHKMAVDEVARFSTVNGFSSVDRQIWSTDADLTADISGSSCTSLLLDSLDRQYRSLLDVMDKHQQQQLETNNAVVMATDEPRRLSLLQELSSIEGSTVSPIEDSPVSSGFSDAVSMVTSSGSDVGCDVTVVSMATQTCDETLIGGPSTPSTSHAPEYRRLFREIFHVLQRPRATCGSGTLCAMREADMPRAIHDMDKPRATSDADVPRVTDDTDMSRALSNVADPIGTIPCSTEHIPSAIVEPAQSLTETVNGESSFGDGFEKQKAARGVPTELPDELPATSSVSADISKICRLERSYADTLKAGVHRGRNSCPR